MAKVALIMQLLRFLDPLPYILLLCPLYRKRKNRRTEKEIAFQRTSRNKRIRNHQESGEESKEFRKADCFDYKRSRMWNGTWNVVLWNMERGTWGRGMWNVERDVDVEVDVGRRRLQLLSPELPTPYPLQNPIPIPAG